MARINYAVTATEPWEAAAALAKVLDLTVNPLAVHEDRVVVSADEDDTEIVGIIGRAIATA
ncbi:hypothetical protein [Dietzia maris]|uniref:hypothetical protein n=1 Tax=Dietzia maris TaxID=37915 RepID=UPI00223AE113|nr:hypothetical protein [Dietzia maris]MCT1435189.1 hypothetical protein [Dietzia maris]MCT1522360.1 hypothetical protein [Dietzia maris]